MPNPLPSPDDHDSARDHDEALRQLLEGSSAAARSAAGSPVPQPPPPSSPRPIPVVGPAAAIPMPDSQALEFLNRIETAQEREHRELYQFFLTLQHLTPRSWVARALIVVNVAVFLVMAASGVGLLMPDSNDLIRWGANYGPRVADGEWWRLLTAMFLHIGVIHLAFNMWALAVGGRILEPLVGNVGFLVLYLVSGLCGSLASVIWHPHAVSAGASGAIFGIFGGLLGFLLLRHDSVPQAILRQLRNTGGTFVFINLIFGLQIKGIDMAAHLGGLIGGFVCGLILSQPLVPAARKSRLLRAAILVALAATVLWPATSLIPLDRVRLWEQIQQFTAVEGSVLDTEKASNRDYNAKAINAQRYAQIIDTEILPPWQKEQERLAAVSGLGPKCAGILAILKDYAAERAAGWKQLAAALRRNDATLLAEAEHHERRAGDLAQQLTTALREAGLLQASRNPE